MESMITTGNDNYRPGLQPPKPIKGGTGWLSSNMAQLMVFLNGLILTITAFATLSVFIDEIVQENLIQTAEDTKEYIVSHYEQTENKISSMGTLISLLDNEKTSELFGRVSENSDDLDGFENIFWLTKNGEERKWTLHSLYQKSYSYYSKEFVRSLALMVMSREVDNSKALNEGETIPVRFVTTVPDIVKEQIHLKNDASDSLFSLVQEVRVNGDITDYVIGIGKFDGFFNETWLAKRPLVYSVDITDAQTQAELYQFKREVEGQEKADKKAQGKFFAIQFSDKEIDIKLNMLLGTRESFLKKIPLLMLLFGSTLTLIGTLYVRNNQRQSLRLAKMNKELAYKNFELNQQFSEREELNKAMAASEKEHRSIINSVSDIIFETDTQGKILFLNETWKKITGFELDRSVGRVLFDLIYVQDQEEQKQNFQQLLKGQKSSYRSFTRIRTSEGTFRSVELAMSMIRQDKEKEFRVVGTITDVEERRRAERALSEAEKKYRAIVENAAGGIYQVTPEGQFLSANPAMSHILGYRLPEEILRDVGDSREQVYVDTLMRKNFLKEVDDLGYSKNYEAEIRKKNGDIIWVSENVRPVKDEEGTLLYYEGSMEDITKRKTAEIALREAKVESDLANRAKSEFLANMSHELRTPLNAIIGFSSIITEETYGPVGRSEYKDYACDINNSGKNLLNIINEILDVSRIDAGERTLNEGAVDIVKITAGCLSLMETKIRENDLTIDNQLGQLDVGLIGESQAVKQMMMNLISNAVKFTPSNGVITIAEELDTHGRLRVSVTDTGMGLDEEEVQKALSPFGQIEGGMSKSGSGTGLGLTLVHSLINLHGGELEFMSQKGIGTTVTLVFPKARVTKADVADEPEEEMLIDKLSHTRITEDS